MSGPLRWRLRRGMKELDVIFERYHEQRYPDAPGAQRAAFERLLDCEDPQIWAWLMGQAPVPTEFEDVVAALRRKH